MNFYDEPEVCGVLIGLASSKINFWSLFDKLTALYGGDLVALQQDP